MHKLVILIGPLEDWSGFDQDWPGFLHQAEMMPGLMRESTGHVERMLYGESQYARMHELYFASLEDLHTAMSSPQGREAGSLLQRITQGKMTLFIADHKEDDLENIRKHKTVDDETN
jgi:uncharacterized protein (TIGR02118 family)